MKDEIPASSTEVRTGVESQNTQGLAPKKPTARAALLESIAFVLLSLATVGTAWCSYEATIWGGFSQRTTNLSAASARKAAAAELQASQMALLDVLLFSQHINARANSNQALAAFYAARFRGEAKTAFEAWLRTQPYENPDAPPHPFVTNFYQPHLLGEARLAAAESQRLWQQAGAAGANSRNYALVTVLLACALFCGGTASKFEAIWIRRAVLILGLATFLFAMVRVWSIPMRL
jgi:hypothetical protein